MPAKARYSIGEMSELCQISKKTLRYYDKLGLITSHRQDYNNYRYYTADSLLLVPVLKYYKQMGFKLDEMRAFIEGNIPNVYSVLRNSFLEKIKELKAEQEELQRKYTSVTDWHNLILEAETVISNDIHEVSVKYIEQQTLLYQEQFFDNDIKASIINIDFTNYVEATKNKITGPVMINFSSFSDRMRGQEQKVKIMQNVLPPSSEGLKMPFGGGMMASSYHTGSHDSIQDTYKRIQGWAKEHDYVLGTESFERYVTDYWTTSNSAQFVTEVMVAVSRQVTDALAVHAGRHRG